MADPVTLIRKPDQARAPSVLFAGAAHIDRLGLLQNKAQWHRSNPGAFMQQAGGAALNVASNFVQMGGKARLMSILGEDAQAGFIRQTCDSRGIALSAQADPGQATASYTSIIEPDGALVIALADMGIYDAFRAPSLFEDHAHPGEAFPGQAYDLVCVDANLPGDEIGLLLGNNACPTAALTVSSAKAARLLPHLGRISILFTNRAEAEALVGRASDPQSMVAALSDLGPETVVVSDGSADVHFLHRGESGRATVPSNSDVADVTGAGDALAAGCLYGLMSGWTCLDSIGLGIRAAQKVLEIRGPWREDLAAALMIED